MSARQSPASEIGSTAELTVASMPGRSGASWLCRSVVVLQDLVSCCYARVNNRLPTHLQSRMSCSKATKVFHITSYKFCSSTVSDVASSVGNGATARDVLA